MKYLLLILCLTLTSCTFLYDSRDQNQISNPEYKGATAKNIKTGRLIKIKVFHK